MILKIKAMILSLGLGLISLICQGQQLFTQSCLPIQITLNKTVNLIFPYTLKSVDRGSSDILAQKAAGAENILQLKARGSDFQQSSLSVVTSDGKLYCFLVSYESDPLQLTMLVSGDPETEVAKSSLPNEKHLEVLAADAITTPNYSRGISDKNAGTKLKLLGVYIKDDVLFFKLDLLNKAQLSYQIETLRVFVKDKKRLKRQAVQQTEIIPIWKSAIGSPLGFKDQTTLVTALSKFYFSNKKILSIELTEKSAGRNLTLKIPGKTLLSAKPLP